MKEGGERWIREKSSRGEVERWWRRERDKGNRKERYIYPECGAKVIMTTERGDE